VIQEAPTLLGRQLQTLGQVELAQGSKLLSPESELEQAIQRDVAMGPELLAQTAGKSFQALLDIPQAEKELNAEAYLSTLFESMGSEEREFMELCLKASATGDAEDFGSALGSILPIMTDGVEQGVLNNDASNVERRVFLEQNLFSLRSTY